MDCVLLDMDCGLLDMDCVLLNMDSVLLDMDCGLMDMDSVVLDMDCAHSTRCTHVYITLLHIMSIQPATKVVEHLISSYN